MKRSLLISRGYCLLLAGLLTLAAEARGENEAPREESLPDGLEVKALEVFPKSIELQGPFSYRQLLLTGILTSGDRADLTRLAEVKGGDGIVEVSPNGLVTPRGEGTAELALNFGEHSIKIGVAVVGLSQTQTVSFSQDVMPNLSKLGCNAGTCHGSAKGRNGFKLSLRGYDPVFDHRALTDDHQGRRFNRAAPDRSLFLLKLSGGVPHVGGVLTNRSARRYSILRDWVAGGAQLDTDAAEVVRIDVEPKNLVMPLPGMKQQIAVTAFYSDDTVRDVTAEAFVESSNTEVTGVDGRGVVTALRRGESAILVRFEGRYAATPFIVMGDRSGFVWKEVSEHNYVDNLVYKKLQKVKAVPSELCTDAEFIRRVYLDLVGLQPTPREVRTFLMDARDSRIKREELVDRLVGSADFVEFWTNKWADLLQVNRKFLGKQGAESLRLWIREAVASNMAYDRLVHTLLTADGSTIKNPPAAYFKILREPELVMENTTQLFLGVRFNCNKCHDHPFERWTQDNYWELSSFFAQVGRKNAPGSPVMPRTTAVQGARPAFEEIIFDKNEGEVTPPTGKKVLATFPYTHEGELPSEGTRRQRFASWLTSKENPYFAKSLVNRLWSYFLGVGLIDPVDDIRAGNPPTNPELLERLTQEFIDSGFDLRGIMKRVLKSRVYQHSIVTTKWNEDDEINFSHALARRLPAETLYDAIHRATGTVTRIPGMRKGSRAAEVLDASVKLQDGFLDLFGRPPRESSCECERTSGMSLSQSLSLVNGPTVAQAINDPENGIADLLAFEKNPGRIVDELFLSFLCRFPTDSERKAMVAAMEPSDVANLAALSPEALGEVAAAQDAWEKAQVVISWSEVKPAFARSAGGATLELAPDGAVHVQGDVPEKDTYTVIVPTELKGITGVQLEVLADDKLPGKGPGLAENGNFVLTEFAVAAIPARNAKGAVGVTLQNATQTFTQKDFAAAQAIDGKVDQKGWAVSPQLSRGHKAIFEFKDDIGFDGGTLLTVTIDQQYGSKHAIGKFKLSVTTTKRPVRVSNLPENIAQAVLTAKEKRTPEQKAELHRYFISKQPEVGERIRAHSAQDIAWALVNSPAFLFNR